MRGQGSTEAFLCRKVFLNGRRTLASQCLYTVQKIDDENSLVVPPTAGDYSIFLDGLFEKCCLRALVPLRWNE